MEDALKISIVTVVYNAVDTIEQTIQSVLNQNYEALEYIVIDGGSTDGTLDIIQKYQNKISYWISEADSGIYNAMNKGIAVSTGEIIAFLNSGDWYEDGIFYYVGKCFKDDIGILAGKVISYGDDIQRVQKGVCDQKELRVRMIYCHQGIFAKRKLFEQYGKFNERYEIAADYEWLLRLHYCGVHIKYVNRVLAYYRIGGVSSGSNFLANHEPVKIALTALRKAKEQNKINDIEYMELERKITKLYDKNMHIFYIKKAIRENLFRNNNFRNMFKNMFDSVYSIFGCGEVGKECMKLLQQLDIQPKCFWDNEEKKWGMKFEGIIIKRPKEIQKDNTIVIIASSYYEVEIKKQLEEMGLKETVNFILYSEIRNRIGSIVQELMFKNVHI